MVYVAYKLLTAKGNDGLSWSMLMLAVPSMAAFLLDAPPPLVLLAAGLVGIFLFR
jgi:chromate transport protein ChrA